MTQHIIGESRPNEGLPSYNDAGVTEMQIDEKQGFVMPPNRPPRDPLILTHTRPICTKHAPSQTPHLDRELQSPKHRDFIRSLVAALSQIVEEGQCTECALEKTAELVAGYVKEMKQAKKEAKWSKEEKRALKKEVKEMGRRVKGTVKAMKRERRL
jgi:hypothetical protein